MRRKDLMAIVADAPGTVFEWGTYKSGIGVFRGEERRSGHNGTRRYMAFTPLIHDYGDDRDAEAPWDAPWKLDTSRVERIGGPQMATLEVAAFDLDHYNQVHAMETDARHRRRANHDAAVELAKELNAYFEDIGGFYVTTDWAGPEIHLTAAQAQILADNDVFQMIRNLLRET